MCQAEIVFVRLLFPFTAGIIICYAFPMLIPLKLLMISCALLLTFLLILNIGYKKFKVYRFKGSIAILFYTLLFLFGGLSCLMNQDTIQPDYYANLKPRYLKILVEEEPQQKNNILRFKAEVIRTWQDYKSHLASGRLLVAIKTDSIHPVTLKYGDELVIPATYSPVKPPNNPSEFDFQSWLAAQNIYLQVFLDQNKIIKLKNHQGNQIIDFALKLRQKQITIYRKLISNDQAFAVASTLILGYRADLSAQTLTAYSKTGTIHALSVSGMHVGFIYFILNQLLWFLNRKRSLKIIKAILILTLIWFYAMLTGFSPSVLRAAIMLSVFVLSKSFDKKTNNYNILAFSAFCLLIYNPFLIWDVGFQLSFLSVFGLIYLKPKIYHFCYLKNKWADKLWEILAMSLAAQLVTFPLSIYYFHQFPFYFLIGNLFMMLPVAVMMYMGLAILLFKLYFLAPVFEWIISFTNKGLSWIAHLPHAALYIWIDKIELYLLYMAMTIFVLSLVKYNKTLLFIALSCFIGLLGLLDYNQLQTYHQQKVILFKLPKNHAAAFLLSNRAILMTDLDPKSKTFQYFIKPALDQHKITEVRFIFKE